MLQINTFWDITKRQLDEAQATIRNKERELEDAEEHHQVEIKVKECEREKESIVMMFGIIV